MNRRTLLRSSLLGLAGTPLGAASDPLRWESMMRLEWKRPARLDLYRGVHPRLFLTDERISRLRRKIANTHKEVWEIVEENARVHLGKLPPSNYKNQGDMRRAGRGIPWQALAYAMTRDPAYLESANKWMLAVCEFPHWENDRSLAAGECLFGVSIGYDWLHRSLNTAQRAMIRAKLVHQAETLKNGPPVHHDRWLANHNHVEHLGLAAAGFALFDEVPRGIEWIRQSDLVFRAMLEASGNDGGSTEGHQYWGYTTEAALRYLELARDLLGAGHYGHPWLKSVPSFIIHSTIPDFSAGNCVMSFGDSHRDYASHGPVHILYRLAAEYRNAHAQWLALEMQRRRVGRDAYCHWANLLWYDETVTPVPLSRLPAMWHCDDVGWITCRSGWDDSAVMVGFKCGPMHGHLAQRYYDVSRGSCHEIGGGHGHPDVNSFQVYAYGKWLAIDPGYERPKWTSNHNCILVNGRGQLGEGQTWFDRDAVLRTGAASQILKAEHTAAYDYIAGDAKTIYPSDTGLRKFHRHLLYLRPDFIVVADDLEADPPAVFTWLLHTEAGLTRTDERRFVVRTGDVLMDLQFLLPERIAAEIEGRTLRVSAERFSNGMILAVLHPRLAAAPAATAELKSHHGDRLEIVLGSRQRRMRLNWDVPRRSVN